MKLSIVVRVPAKYESLSITEIARNIEDAVNGVAEGRISAAYNATTSAPTAGSYQLGDEVRNTNPSELGTAGGKYVIRGWICTGAGDPPTFKEMRVLTGN